MKAKNIMLLGFVKAAVEYLDTNIKDSQNENLIDMQGYDLKSLQEHLQQKLESYTGLKTVSSLLQSGNEAFNQFVSETENDNSKFVSQLNKLFSIDLNDDLNDDDEKLKELLSFYNQDDFKEEYEEYKDYDEFEEFVPSGLLNRIPLADVDEKIENDLDQVIDSAEEDNSEPLTNIISEENLEDLFVSDDDEYLKVIRNNAIKSEEEVAPKDIYNDDKIHDEIDSLLSDIIEHESDPYNDPLLGVDLDAPLVEPLQFNSEETIEEENDDIDISDYYADLLKDIKRRQDFEDKNIKEEDLQKAKEVSFASEEVHEETIEEVVPDNEEVDDGSINDSYLNSLIADLKKRQEIEDAREKEERDRMAEVYEKVGSMYPYLSKGFIKGAYDLRDSFKREYGNQKEIVILHRIIFKDVEELRQFAEIVLNHGYNINVDEEKMIVDVFKQHDNADGKILSNIYEIANQAKLLNGEYDGYKVVTDKD